VRGQHALASLGAVAALVVAACGGSTPSATPGTSATGTIGPAPTPAVTVGAVPSVAATVTPSPTQSTGPGRLDVLLPGSAVTVAVAELNLREGPSTSSKRVETLKKGAILIVSPYDGIWLGVGPVRKDGYRWYPVMKLQVAGADGALPPLPTRPIILGTEVVTGWVAANDGSTPYVIAVPPRCPGTVDLANVEAMLSAERLACFGGGPIVLEGTFGCDGCGGAFPGSFEPSWLASPDSFDFLSANVPEQFGPVALRFPPGGPERPAAGTIIRVTVHVDDPAATTCRMSGLEGDDELVPIPNATAVLFCREQLVVESYVIIGVDPDFGG
jgi:hypothetical protein